MASHHTYAIFSTRYAPLTGGVESFSQRLAHELVLQGNHVFIVTSQPADTPAHEVQDDGVEVYRVPSWNYLGGRFPVSRINKAYQALFAELSSKNIDRVLVNNRFYRHSLEGVRFAKQIDAPVYVLDHGSAHLTFSSAKLDWLVERYEHSITKRMMALKPNFAGISHASIEWLKHFGIDTKVVIPNAIDVEAFQNAAEEASIRNALAIKPSQVVVAFVGRLEPEKGAVQFVQAAQLLGNDYACLMAGDGSLKSQIENIGLANVWLLGKLDQPKLSALLRDADVFCLPSRSEGFCTSLLEAAAQGCIPVMPHVGGTDEVMGVNPLRFGVMLENTEPGCIASGVRHAATLKEQSEKLIQYVVTRWNWNRTVTDLDEAFKRVEV